MKDSCPDLLLPKVAAGTHHHQLFQHQDKGADGWGRVASTQPVLRCRGRIRAELPGRHRKAWGVAVFSQRSVIRAAF